MTFEEANELLTGNTVVDATLAEEHNGLRIRLSRPTDARDTPPINFVIQNVEEGDMFEE